MKTFDDNLGYECDEGRIEIPLSNGTSLSCITPDRTAYINKRDPLLGLEGALLGTTVDARATHGTYEVAIVTTGTDAPRSEIEPEEFTPYFDNNDPIAYAGGWRIWSNVPARVILDYANKVGLKKKVKKLP